LGSAQSASRIVLQLPASWGARNQTLSVLGSTDGSNFTTVVGSATYAFNPSGNNTVTITFSATSQRYWRLNFTANTGLPARPGSQVPGLEQVSGNGFQGGRAQRAPGRPVPGRPQGVDRLVGLQAALAHVVQHRAGRDRRLPGRPHQQVGGRARGDDRGVAGLAQ